MRKTVFEEECCEMHARYLYATLVPAFGFHTKSVDIVFVCPRCHEERNLRFTSGFDFLAALVLESPKRRYHTLYCPAAAGEPYRRGWTLHEVFEQTLLVARRPQPCDRCLGPLAREWLGVGP